MSLPIISPLSVCLVLPGPAQLLSITKVYGEGTYSLPRETAQPYNELLTLRQTLSLTGI